MEALDQLIVVAGLLDAPAFELVQERCDLLGVERGHTALTRDAVALGERGDVGRFFHLRLPAYRQRASPPGGHLIRARPDLGIRRRSSGRDGTRLEWSGWAGG